MSDLPPLTRPSEASAPVPCSALAELHVWLMAKKHDYLVEQASWTMETMKARQGGKAAAAMEILAEIRRLMVQQNAAAQAPLPKVKS